MEKFYEVTLDGNVVGKVTVQTRGLYYRFLCRCRLTNDRIYRLMISDGVKEENLGIPVPDEDCFLLETKLPVKRLETGDMRFYLVPKQGSVGIIFIPISPDEPFAYISRLKSSFLQIRKGTYGIGLSKKQEC